MSMRQLHADDSLKIHVTDRNGHRQGILLSKHHQWCWVAWEDVSAPASEHIEDLWVLDGETSLYDQLAVFVRAWRPSPQTSLAMT